MIAAPSTLYSVLSSCQQLVELSLSQKPPRHEPNGLLWFCSMLLPCVLLYIAVLLYEVSLFYYQLNVCVCVYRSFQTALNSIGDLGSINRNFPRSAAGSGSLALFPNISVVLETPKYPHPCYHPHHYSLLWYNFTV
jgi:hypothetical protein